MFSHANVPKNRRFRGFAALVGVVIVAPACFLPNPPVDADPTEAASTSTTSGDTSTGEQPTTGDGSTSTGAETTTTGIVGTSTTDTSTTDEAESSGTTEFSLPTCPYEPPGTKVSLLTQVAGDQTLQACGTTQAFDRVLLMTLGGPPLNFVACSDANCEDCDMTDTVDLGLVVPDPFNGYGGGVVEGGCYELGLAWNRPSEDDASLCTGSTVTLRRVLEDTPEVVPSLIYRLSSMLNVVDELDEFSLAADAAGVGTIACPCEGDCCREDPGTRDVQFTVGVGEDKFVGDPLQAEQAQSIPLGLENGEPNIAEIALVRSHFSSDCAALPTHEWLFTFPNAG
jgi:hypothetical protein